MQPCSLLMAFPAALLWAQAGGAWKPLSSKTGDLAAPNSGTQQMSPVVW